MDHREQTKSSTGFSFLFFEIALISLSLESSASGFLLYSFSN